MQDAIIIGAGPSGLAVAACLQQQGITPLVLEREATVGSAWHRHYDRLHLHTARETSHLPGLPFPDDWPRYVPRAQVVAYLDRYAAHFGIAPQFGAEVQRITRMGDMWQVAHSGGTDQARTVILATGFAQQPFNADWPGLDGFPGPVLHTRDYKNPNSLPGQRVLVVGFGNSGGEIAIDLAEAGRDVTMAVRSPVNILPKEVLGVPIASLGGVRKLFGYRVADMLFAPVLRLMIGDFTRYGLRKAAKGPNAQIIEDGRIPLIDIGTLDLIRRGQITVRPGLSRIDGATVQFTDGTRDDFDAILMATGYRVDLRPILGADHPGLDAHGRPVASGAQIADMLWAISYHAVPNGQLREIARQAPLIADQVAGAVRNPD